MNRLAKAYEYWRANPVEYAKDVLRFTPEDYQGDIINATLKPGAGQGRTVVKSAHGVGKSATAAICGFTFLDLYQDSLLVATAPTQPQLRDILWPEISRWVRRAPIEISSRWEIGVDHIRYKTRPLEWFATARTSNKPTNLQGLHNKNVLIIGDEGSGIPEPVFEVMEGILSDAEKDEGRSLLLLIGNPNFTEGEFFKAFTKNKDIYDRFTITGDPTTKKEDVDGRFYISKRVTQRYRKVMSQKYGSDGAVYDVRVRGKFPMNVDKVVVPLGWALNAAQLPLPPFDDVADPVHLAMDVARFGGDETVLMAFRKNQCIVMNVWAKTSTTQCVMYLKEAQRYWNAMGINVGKMIVDEPGVGGGVVDQARNDGLPIVPYHGGEGLRQDTDPEDDIRMFSNRRARDWWNVRRLMELNLLHIPNDEELINQLASVQYDYNERDKIRVETKKEMRERLGEKASPDRADTLVMGVAKWYSLRSSMPHFGIDDYGFGSERPALEAELM